MNERSSVSTKRFHLLVVICDVSAVTTRRPV